MTRADIQREVLDLADEDLYGVWEIGWRLRTALGVDPTIEPEEAAIAIEALLAQHLVEIYVREWTDDDPLPIGTSGRSLDLHDPRAWLVPDEGGPQFLIGG